MNENNFKITNKPINLNERKSYVPMQGMIKMKLPKEMVKYKSKENLSKE